MYSDSRKAQRSSFARYRAELLFSRHHADPGETAKWAATIHEGTEPLPRKARIEQVRRGLLGFVPMQAKPA